MSLDVSRFQNADGEWLDTDEWPLIDADVTCHTPECKVEGVTFRERIAENVDGVFRVECGRCGKEPEIVFVGTKDG